VDDQRRRGHLAQPRVLAAHGIHPHRFVREVTAKAAGNFQYLTSLARTLDAAVDELPDLPAPRADLEWLLNVQDLPDGLDLLYEHFLSRVRRDAAAQWEPVHLAVLGLLAVARAPLTRRQLEASAGYRPATTTSKASTSCPAAGWWSGRWAG
jgi:hypothetical protein